MSDIKANIVVNQLDTTIQINQTDISFTPSDIQMRVFTGGPTGDQGIQGYTGSAGSGYTGSQGAPGSPGGYTGSQGFTGSKGDQGYIGSQGIGFVGSQGFTGSKGDQGIQGFIGSQGTAGPAGGYTGSQGYTGSRGAASNYIENGTSRVEIPTTDGNTVIQINGINNIATYSVDGFSGQFLKFNEKYIDGGSVSGTITPNSANGSIYKYTLTGNVTINSISNVVTGTSMTIILQQDNVGGRTLTSNMKFNNNGYKRLSAAATTTDIMFVFYSGSEYYASISNGFV